MEELKDSYYSYGSIGSFSDVDTKITERKDIVVQSLWTKPITDLQRLKDTLWITALSLLYAHKNGYKVHMHTDSKGAVLLKGFGYDKLETTLDMIPASVPTDLFAAGKYYAMMKEGFVGKVHIDVDVFLKKPGVLDCFYVDKVDAICQMEEDMSQIDHSNKITHMYVMGYPKGIRPDWKGSMNTGIVGFNDAFFALNYFSLYNDALRMYKADKFEKYKKENGLKHLNLDFILEQITLSYLSNKYEMHPLLPTKNVTFAADKLGYQHIQGNIKWDPGTLLKVKALIRKMDSKFYITLFKLIHTLK